MRLTRRAVVGSEVLAALASPVSADNGLYLQIWPISTDNGPYLQTTAHIPGQRAISPDMDHICGQRSVSEDTRHIPGQRSISRDIGLGPGTTGRISRYAPYPETMGYIWLLRLPFRSGGEKIGGPAGAGPPKRNSRNYLVVLGGTVGDGVDVVTGGGVAFLRFLPRNGCTPSSASFS